MSTRGRYNTLKEEMYTLHVESRLAGPLSGNVTVEVNPRERIRNVVKNFFCALQDSNETSGLAVYNESNCKLDWNSTIESQGVKEGSILFISYDKESHLLKPVHIAVVSFSTLIIACVLLTVTTILFWATGGIIPYDYGIIIDAGSTHTEVFLYQWSGDKDRGTGIVHQKNSCEYEVGIASGIDPSHIISCVNNVTSLVPTGVLPVLYLGATAGMRLLNITNPKEASLILMSLKYALSTSSVQVKYVNIIQGEAEAIFSWVSSNSLFHALGVDGRNTYGALDLGGASTQYAFVTHNESYKNQSDITQLKLYGENYFVKSASFLCFGYYEAMSRHEALMFMNNESAILYDPCLPLGYTEKKSAFSFSEEACVRNDLFTNWLHNHSIHDELVVDGASNYKLCKENVLKLMNKSSCEESGYKDCMPDINLKELNMEFTAFSGYYYVVHFLNGTNSLEEFINSTKMWCGYTWEEIQHSQHKSEWEHVLRYCFAATYIIELLTTKYGFDSTTWKKIDFIKKIEDSEIGWTLGYMINATNVISEKLPSSPAISSTIFILLSILSIIMIITAVVIIKNYVNMDMFRKHTRLLEV